MTIKKMITLLNTYDIEKQFKYINGKLYLNNKMITDTDIKTRLNILIRERGLQFD